MKQQPTPDACWNDPDRMTGATVRAGLDGLAGGASAGRRSVRARLCHEVLPGVLQHLAGVRARGQ